MITRIYSLIIVFFISTKSLFGQSPNFILIVADDLGWNGTSVQMDANIHNSKSDFYMTPNLLEFSKEAMIFSQGYSGSPKCSPTRATILTGRSAARNGFTDTDNQIETGNILIEASTRTALDGSWTTYAEWLKSIGLNYRTSHFGKWHQGNTLDSSPETNGFDVNDGSTSNDEGNQGGGIQTDPKNIFHLSSKAENFIQTAVDDGVPFSLQVSYYAVHSEVEYRQATYDIYNDPVLRPIGSRHDNTGYGAMTEDLDEGIGIILDKVKSLGIEDRTYIFIISDNGGQMNYTTNRPLAFGKTFIKEGGIRVPMMIKGPGIMGNTYSTEPIVTYDLFPTIAELTGSSYALPSEMDGQSLVPILARKVFTRDKPLFFHSPHYGNNANKIPRSVAISGNFKLIVEYETNQIQLFDLDTDIGEETDVSMMYPDVKKDLWVELRDHLLETSANMPSLDPTHPYFTGSGFDIDDDGLHDSWELTQMLTYGFGTNDDPDNDGINNELEFLNGTDPLIKNEPLNVLESRLSRGFSIYPNPSKNFVYIEGGEIERINLFSQEGRLVHSSTKHWIRTLGMKHGIYLLEIQTEETKLIYKLIIE